MLDSRIGTLFLAGDTKTSFSLFENVYQFLFVENIVYGIITIVIIYALLNVLFKKAFNASNKDTEYSNGISKEERIDRERTLTSSMKNNGNSSNNTTKENDYSNDLELVAVITAAIMAYMGDDAPEDGLIIRSIRKVNRRNHVNNYID